MSEKDTVGVTYVYKVSNAVFHLTLYFIVWCVLACFLCSKVPQGAETSVLGYMLTEMLRFSSVQSFYVYFSWVLCFLLGPLWDGSLIREIALLSVFIAPRRLTAYMLQEETAAWPKEIAIAISLVGMAAGIVSIIAERFVEPNSTKRPAGFDEERKEASEWRW